MSLIKKYRIGVRPSLEDGGKDKRAEDILGKISNSFFSFSSTQYTKGFMPFLNEVKDAFSYEYFYNGKELSFNTYLKDDFVDEATGMFYGNYNVVNIQENVVDVLNYEKIKNFKYATKIIGFSGADKTSIYTFKELQSDYLILLLTQLVKNNNLRIGYKVDFRLASNDYKEGMHSYDKNKKNEVKNKFNIFKEEKQVNLGEYEGKILQRNSDKIMSPTAYWVEIKIIVYTENKDISFDIIQGTIDNIAIKFSNLVVPGTKLNFHKESFKDFIYKYNNNIISSPTINCGSILTPMELTTIIHPPTELNLDIPNIGIDLFKKLPIHKDLMGVNQGIILGENVFGNKRERIRVPEKVRFRHIYAIGKTGTGKSVFLSSLALQDIYNGDGLCLIDPHGDLVEDILKHIPPERVKDLVYFNAGRFETPIGLNIMDFKDDIGASMFANYMLSMIKKLYEDNEEAVTAHFEDYIRSAIQTIHRMNQKGKFKGTILELGRFLTHEEFLKEGVKCLDPIQDTDTITYWQKHNERIEAGAEYAQEIIPHITTKLTSFTKNLVVKNIVGQETSSIDFKDIMDNKKILLVSLPKGEIQEFNMKMLGILIVQKIVMEAYGRGKVPEETRVPFYLYVDEFQNFITKEFEEILSELRKYKLGLTVAHQFISQLEGRKGDNGVKDAIFGNVGTLVSFRVGGEDAEELEKHFANKRLLQKEDFSNLDNFSGYVNYTVNPSGKSTTPPCSFESIMHEWKYDNTKKEGLIEKIKSFSIKKYSGSIDLVQEHEKAFFDKFGGGEY